MIERLGANGADTLLSWTTESCLTALGSTASVRKQLQDGHNRNFF